MNSVNMMIISQKMGNNYIEKYNKYVPIYPRKDHIHIRKTNNFDEVFFKNVYEERIPKLREITKNLPNIPDEIWCIILYFMMHLEKFDNEEYNDWLYSSYSLAIKPGMKLRSRQLYLPNICGIILNEIQNFVKCAERTLSVKGIKKKIIIENISEKFINCIVKWYWWLNKANDYNSYNNTANKFSHLIYELQLKSKYFLEEVDREKYTKKAYSNFYSAHYFIHTYYKNEQFDMLSYKDIDFEIYIFKNAYYNKVYKNAMVLRNYKRINLSLHE